MRVVSVLVSGFALGLLYLFAYQFSRSVLVGLLTTIITAYIPAFLQRTQVLNVDVFLLVGWLGYILWYRRFWVGTLFLLIGVLSKSLLGFFPVFMVSGYELYLYITAKRKNAREIVAFLQTVFWQLVIALLWFAWMYYRFGYAFIQYHIIDSHFKRVTASIEQHFGQRTFYIDVIIAQIRWLLIPAILSSCVLAYEFLFKKKREAFFSLILLPWFIFLNLTKTKIEWYIYPVIPQFVYLSMYPVKYIKKWWAQGALFVLILVAFFYSMAPLNAFVTANYSPLEDHQRIAMEAHTVGCTKLFILVSKDTRTSYTTLASMDLVIHTTTWWGDHPSMAYYADAKTQYIYSTNEMENLITLAQPKTCFIETQGDWNGNPQLRVLAKNKGYVLGAKK